MYETLTETPKIDGKSPPKLEIEQDDSESDVKEQLLSPSKDVRNKWSYEELA